MDALFAPRNVVFVGASDRNWSPRIWQNLKRFGYAGKVYPVNPNRTELWGEPCYPSLADLPEPPDHLALFVPADASLDILEQAGPLGARSASLFAAGFGEGGDEKGRARASRLRAILQQTGIAAIGPNCMGLAAGAARFSTIPDEQLEPLAPGPVAAMTQSGMLVQTIGRGLNDAGLQLSYLLSCGNQIGLTIADFIDYLADDPLLRVMVCYIEAVPDAARFLAAARKADANGKTIVAVKIGGSEEARAAALAHTGSLAGSLDAFDAYAREAGIVRAETLEDAVEAAEYLVRMPRPRGRRIAVMTNSGALKSLVTQAADGLDVVLPPVTEEARAALNAAMPDAEAANPFDCKRTLATDQYLQCIAAVHGNANADVTLLAEELPRAEGIGRKEANFAALEKWIADGGHGDKPLAVFSPLSLQQTPFMKQMRKAMPHVPWMRDILKALRTMSRVADTRRSGAMAEDSSGPAVSGEERARLLRHWRLECAKLSGPVALNEVQSKSLLASYNIPMPREEFAGDWPAAQAAGERIGYPLVLKGVSAQVTHKSDLGLVIVGIESAEALEAAFDTIRARCASQDVRLQGVLVAEQVTGGTEMVLGVHRDPEVGPVVMAGMGGVWLELFKDVAFAVPGLGKAAALEAIGGTRASQLLAGYRGSPPRDIDALAEAMVALGAFARDFGDLVESVDLNPVLVRDAGRGVCALDALVVLRPPES